MTAYMIIATVNGNDYLTKVSAESESGAEHAVLDLSVSGRHEYAVTACMAYDTKAMKYDTFVYHAIGATPISFEALKEIIEKKNAEILEKDAAERRIAEIEKEMQNLKKELEEAKAILAK